jgi:hypothetical protein
MRPVLSLTPTPNELMRHCMRHSPASGRCWGRPMVAASLKTYLHCEGASPMPSTILSAWARVFPPSPHFLSPGRSRPIRERKTMSNAGHWVMSSSMCCAQALDAPNMVCSALMSRQGVEQQWNRLLCSPYLFCRSLIHAPDNLASFLRYALTRLLRRGGWKRGD